MTRKFALAALLACIGLAQPAPAQQRSNAVTWGLNAEVDTLDPYATSKRTAQLVIRNVLENLLVRDPASGKAKPALATSWNWVDPTTLDLQLRRGVTFHDGSPFTADDVVYTVDYIKNPANNATFAKADYGFIKSAEKLDALAVRLRLETRQPSCSAWATAPSISLSGWRFLAIPCSQYVNCVYNCQHAYAPDPCASVNGGRQRGRQAGWP